MNRCGVVAPTYLQSRPAQVVTERRSDLIKCHSHCWEHNEHGTRGQTGPSWIMHTPISRRGERAHFQKEGSEMTLELVEE